MHFFKLLRDLLQPLCYFKRETLFTTLLAHMARNAPDHNKTFSVIRSVSRSCLFHVALAIETSHKITLPYEIAERLMLLHNALNSVIVQELL